MRARRFGGSVAGRARRGMTAGTCAIALLASGSAWGPAEGAVPADGGPPDGHAGPAARRVLADPRAEADLDHWSLNASGSILQTVVVRGTGPGSCQGVSASAWVLLPARGPAVAWVGRAYERMAVPVIGGFAVGAAIPGCGKVTGAAKRAYLVADSGARRPVVWKTPAAKRICLRNPADLRCEFSLRHGSGRLVRTTPVPSTYPKGALDVAARDGHRVWARSVDSRRLYWSDDYGATWEQKTTRLPRGQAVLITRQGRWVAFTNATGLEVSSDRGRTWRVRDLSAPLRSVPAVTAWEITPAGTLLASSTTKRFGNRLYRGAAPWRHFTRTRVRTKVGLVQVEVRGPWAYVVDRDRWWRSADDGRRWRTASPFGVRWQR